MDLVVENRVVTELKAVDKLIPLFDAQLMTYLRLSGHRVGPLFNFNSLRLTDGLVRRVI